MPKGGLFFFKYIMKDEDIFAGAETVTNSFVGQLGSRLLGIYLLSFELEKKIRNCKMEPAITPCVDKYYKETGYDTYKASDLLIKLAKDGKKLGEAPQMEDRKEKAANLGFYV